MTVLVSVVVPARDEEASIAACISALAAQDHPCDRLEVLVVDGGSTDRTVQVATEALAEAGFARSEVLASAAGTTPANLNVGLAAARGEIVCRVDARSLVPAHYVRICAEVLDRPEVAVVGGTFQARPAPGGGAVAAGIARAYNNRWTTGMARYRSGRPSGPSDTVYLGAFRREQLAAEGGWDERLSANQDFDLNRRMSRLGTVWFDERLQVIYVPRADLVGLHRHFVRLGRGKATYWRTTGDRPRPRQVALLAGPPVVAVAWACALRRTSPSRRAALLAGTAAAGLGIEVTGAAEPRTRAAGHLAGLAGIVAMDGGWLRGVAAETLGGQRRAAGRP